MPLCSKIVLITFLTCEEDIVALLRLIISDVVGGHKIMETVPVVVCVEVGVDAAVAVALGVVEIVEVAAPVVPLPE